MVLAFAVTACATGPKISTGSVVKVEYKGTLKDGTVFDTTDGKAPLSFLMGSGQVLPKFEENVAKIGAGKTGKFTIKAADAYRAPDPEKVRTYPRNESFKDVELKEGIVLFANTKLPNGQVQQRPMKVIKLTDEEVTMDLNHPLAGQDLTFEVKVIDVTEPQSTASSEEAKTDEAA